MQIRGMIIALIVGIILVGLIHSKKPSHLAGCISLNLIKNQVNKSTLGSYCWTDNSGSYCITRR